MAINFAEVFLRESGAEQDRAQSMAEMQLRAKQFEQNYAIALARQKVAERQQEMAEAGQTFTQDRLTRLDNIAEEDRQYYIDNVRPLELKQLENNLQQSIYTTAIQKAQVEDLNSTIPDDIAEQLNLDKETSWREAERIILGRKAINELMIQQEMVDASDARKQLYSSLRAYQEREIKPEEFRDFATEDEKVGGFERFAKRLVTTDIPFTDTNLRDLVQISGLGRGLEFFTGIDENEYNFRTLQMGAEADLGVSAEGMLRLGGENRASLLDPLNRDILNAANLVGSFNTNPMMLNQQATGQLFDLGVNYPGADQAVIQARINELLEGVTPSEE